MHLVAALSNQKGVSELRSVATLGAVAIAIVVSGGSGRAEGPSIPAYDSDKFCSQLYLPIVGLFLRHGGCMELERSARDDLGAIVASADPDLWARCHAAVVRDIPGGSYWALDGCIHQNSIKPSSPK
jgi:hypothetical protein